MKVKVIHRRSTVLFLLLVLGTLSANSQTLEASLQNLLKNYSDKKTGLDTTLKPINLGRAIILAPNHFTNKRTGTKDSDRGELTGPGLIVYYDIGMMAGTHMTDKSKSDCSYYEANIYNGYKTYIGLRKRGDSTELVITIWDRQKTDKFPANFWAKIQNQADIKSMLIIVMNCVFRGK